MTGPRPSFDRAWMALAVLATVVVLVLLGLAVAGVVSWTLHHG